MASVVVGVVVVVGGVAASGAKLQSNPSPLNVTSSTAEKPVMLSPRPVRISI